MRFLLSLFGGNLLLNIAATAISIVIGVLVRNDLWLGAIGILICCVTFAWAYNREMAARAKSTKEGSAEPRQGESAIHPFGGFGGFGDFGRVAKALNMVRSRNDEVVTESAAATEQEEQERPKQKGTPLQVEAVKIGAFLRNEYGLNVGVNPFKDGAIMQTPLHNLIRLIERSPVDIGRIQANSKAIGRHVYGLRNGKGGMVTVRAVDTQPLYLQVSRQDPQPHLWSDREWDRHPMETCLGDYWMGNVRIPLTVNLFGPGTDLANGLFCGQPGSGKTTVLRLALLGLFESTGPEDLHVYSIDTKANALSIFRKLPHMKATTSNFDEAAEIIEQFVEWCKDESRPTDGAHRLLVIDEFHDIISEGDNHANLSKIMNKGREFGIRVWACTPVPDRYTYPPGLKGVTHFKVAGMVENDGYLKNPLGVYGASNLIPKREVIFKGVGLNHQIATFWLPDDEMAKEIERIGAMYGVRITADSIFAKPKEVRISADFADLRRSSPMPVVDFPISPARELTDDEAVAAYRMWNQADKSVRSHNAKSMNKLYHDVFGGPGGGDRRKYLKEAFDRAEKLLRIGAD